MSHIKDFPVTVGGEPHRGWLPPGAATPLPTPRREVTINATIEFDGSGYLLIIESTDGSVRGDRWHETVDDAREELRAWFDVPVTAWQDAPDELKNQCGRRET